MKTSAKARAKARAKRPRFEVGSVSGWAISQNATGRSRVDSNREPPTIWYVFDRFYCYRPVAVFYGRNYGHYGAKQGAQTAAERMNREWQQ